MRKAQYTYVGRDKDKLLVREVLASGKRRTTMIDYNPELFIETKSPKETGWRNIYGVPLEPKYFDSIKSFQDFIRKAQNSPGGCSRINGCKSVEYQYIHYLHNKHAEFDPDVFRVCYFDIEVFRDPVRGYAPPDNPFNPVCLITAYLPFREDGDQIHVFALNDKPYQNEDSAVNYRTYGTDNEMIHEFFRFMTESEVDILTGWNIENYDVPYLCGRLLGLWDEDAASKKKKYFDVDIDIVPFGIIKRREVPVSYGKTAILFEIPGWENLDYFHLYKKFSGGSQESYSLNNISSVELGEKKVDYSEMQHLQELYEKDYQKFVRYGIKDTILVSKLEEKLKYILLSTTLAYMIGCNLTDIFSPVRSWEVFLYHEMSSEYIAPPIEKDPGAHKEDFIGAFVKDPVRGKHEWCISLDLNSLYPHIMIFANMSPETYVRHKDMVKDQKLLYQNLQANVEDSIVQLLDHKVDLSILKERNVAMTPNGAMFSKDVQGIIPRIVKKLYANRKIVKGNMLEKEQEYENDKNSILRGIISALNAKQIALKVFLNSLYGGTGNEYFLFFNTDFAEGITSMGQMAIRYIGQELEKYLNDMLKTPDYARLLYSDTDSTYISLGDLAEKFRKAKPDITDNQLADLLDKFTEEKIQPFIDETYEKLRDYLNGYEQSLKMKREKIIKSVIFVQKKRYTMAVIDNEGVRYHDLKVSTTGLESVRSTTPEALRKKLKEFERILLLDTEDAAQSFLTEMKKEFRQYRIEDVAVVKTVNNIEKWVNADRSVMQTGAPQQVKAATLYNKLMLEHDPHANLIISGDKIHLVYIKKSMRFQNANCIAYPQFIPPELGLTREMVDWNEMYEKTFLSAAQILMGALGLEARKRTAVSLASFFG